jgi:hypothetical protein
MADWRANNISLQRVPDQLLNCALAKDLNAGLTPIEVSPSGIAHWPRFECQPTLHIEVPAGSGHIVNRSATRGQPTQPA